MSNPRFRPHYDVVIVGARCAGAATAMLLARAGLSVLAVDQGHYGSDARSTHALMRGAVMQLASWGLLDQIADSGTPAVTTTTFHYAGEPLAVPIQPGDGVDALYAPRRYVLDRVLVDAAREAGATIAHRTRFLQITGTAERADGVVIEDALGSRHTIGAGIVVGADGIGSNVASAVGAETYREARHTSACVYGYWRTQSSGYDWYNAERALAGVIPTHAGLSCVFVCTSPDAFRAGLAEGPDHLLRSVLEHCAPDVAARLAGVPSAEPLRAFSGRRGFMRQSWGPGWALVGDAAYFKDPSTAHGITDALRDAELLARAIIAGGDQALAAYQNTRDELSRDLFQITDEVASHSHDMAALQALHVDLSRAMKHEVKALRALHREGASSLAA